jgi:osmotically-inducible protein OsmY
MAKRYEDRYGRGGNRRDREYAHDRGYAERATDEVRSWFGDDDAERRRYMDEQRDRQHERPRHQDWNRGEWNRGSQSDWNRSSWNRPDYRSTEADYRSGQQASRYPQREWNDIERGPQDWRTSSSDPGRSSDYYGRSWPSQDRDRMDPGYDESRYRDAGYGARSGRTSGWSVDEGRTEFGERWGRGPKGYQRSDSRILEDVCDRLTYSDVDAGEIEVRVTNGEVTLAGSVRNRWDKRRAEDVAEEVSGVRDVHNNIRVSREDRGIGQSDTSMSDQPGTVLGVNPTASSTITNERPKTRS